MHAERFVSSPTGNLVPIAGDHPRFGGWRHVAFVPRPLPDGTPDLQASTFNAVARARAALAALDSAARLPVAGHPPYKVFWSNNAGEPRVEAVFPHP